MRIAAGSLLLVFVHVSSAAEPEFKSVAPPTLMMASSTGGPDGVWLHVRKTVFVPTPVEVRVETPVTLQEIVNGRIVERKSKVTETHITTMMKPTPHDVVVVPLTCSDVTIVDLAGKPIDPKRVPQMLKKETAVLVSFSGPVDPFHLQTTKPGTLVVLMPPHYLDARPTESLPPPILGPTEPPLAPVKP